MGQVSGCGSCNLGRVLGLRFESGGFAPFWAQGTGVLSFPETCCHPLGWLFPLGGQLAGRGARG